MIYSIKPKVVSVLLILILWYSTASAWEKKYLADEFGDADYSKPCYTINCVSPEDNWIQIYIYYINGAFMLEPDYSAEYVRDATKIKAKSSSGSIYEFDFDKPSRNSYQYIISGSSDVETLINLLEQGNFTLSFYRPSNYVQDAFNYNFRIGHQGRGIRKIAVPNYTSMHAHANQGGMDTFKGTIGKMRVTFRFQQYETAEKTSIPNVVVCKGEYWYGDGRNGKMTLKGTYNYITGKIDVVEYDPSGKKCGSFSLTRNADYIGSKGITITGTMVNAKGVKYQVNLKE